MMSEPSERAAEARRGDRSLASLQAKTLYLEVEVYLLRRFCLELASASGISEVYGLPIYDWLKRQRNLELQLLLEEDAEDLDPHFAEALHALIDQAEGLPHNRPGKSSDRSGHE
jgi:hypothetical protein